MKSNPFFLLLGVTLFIASHALLWVDPFVILQKVNAFHFTWLDHVMVVVTQLPQAPWIIGLFLWVGFCVNKRALLLSGLSFTLSGLSAQGLKRWVFPDRLRPHALLDYEHWHRVEGFPMAEHFSFPSGHSAVAFAIGISIALATSSHAIRVLSLCTASIIAYSRMYLLLHFYHDVFAGILLGILSAGIVYRLLSSRLDNEFWARPIMLKSRLAFTKRE